MLFLLGRDCLSASSQHWSRALLTSVNCSNRSGVTVTLASFFNNLKNGVSFFREPWDVITVLVQDAHVSLKCFFGFRKVRFI